jgi:hypothetical protein
MNFCKDNTCFKDGEREKRGRRKIIVGATPCRERRHTSYHHERVSLTPRTSQQNMVFGYWEVLQVPLKWRVRFSLAKGCVAWNIIFLLKILNVPSQLINYKKNLYEIMITTFTLISRNFNFKGDSNILMCKKSWNAWKAPLLKFNYLSFQG